VLAGAIGGRLRRYQTSHVEETRGEHPADGSKNSWLSLDVPPADIVGVLPVDTGCGFTSVSLHQMHMPVICARLAQPRVHRPTWAGADVLLVVLCGHLIAGI
jgi:hypothetical protein